MNDRTFLTCHIAGFTYYDGIDVIKDLEIGTHLTLVAEPENRFDPYAVALYCHETKLGFIPAGENKLISQLLQLGHTDLFEVRINRIALDAHPEKQIGVVVRIRKKEATCEDDRLSAANTTEEECCIPSCES
jgi:hypothetical protein